MDFLTGGFLRGYRTYVLSFVAALAVVANYAVGDLSLTEAINGVALAIGLGTLRAANKS